MAMRMGMCPATKPVRSREESEAGRVDKARKSRVRSNIPGINTTRGRDEACMCSVISMI